MRSTKNINNNINFDYFEFSLNSDILNDHKKDFRSFYATFVAVVLLINSLVFNLSLQFNFLLSVFLILVYFGLTFLYSFFSKKNIFKYTNIFEGFASSLILLSLFTYFIVYVNYFNINVSFMSKLNLFISDILNFFNCSLITNLYNSYLTLINETFIKHFYNINLVSLSKNHIFLVVDHFNITFESILLFFILVSFVCLSFGILLSKNPINSLLFLITTYVYTSIMLVLFKLEFFALLYIIIYVGAIAVLFLFVIMMLKFEKIPEYKLKKSGLFKFFYLVLFIGLSLSFFKLYNSNVLDLVKYSHLSPSAKATSNVSEIALNNYFTLQTSLNDLEDLGLVFYTKYAYVFLMSGLILLVSIIAPILLTFSPRKGVKQQYHSEQIGRDKKYIISLKDIK
jgi:NADH-quinone oxidoreductase subunit J